MIIGWYTAEKLIVRTTDEFTAELIWPVLGKYLGGLKRRPYQYTDGRWGVALPLPPKETWGGNLNEWGLEAE